MMRRSTRPDWVKQTAVERIKILLKQAKEEKNQKLSKRYLALAKKISMRYNTPIPPAYKKKYCKKCGAELSAQNTKTRKKPKQHITTTCLACGHVHRRPVAKKHPKINKA